MWLTFILFNNSNYFFKKPIFLLIFVLSYLSLIMAISFIRETFKKVKNKLNNIKEKERNVKDVYRYLQLLNPPDTGMNN